MPIEICVWLWYNQKRLGINFMNKELQIYIENNFRQKGQSFRDDLYDLFVEFTKTEVESFEDFKNLPDKFGKFIVSYADFIRNYSGDITEEKLIKAAFLVRKMINNQINDRIRNLDQRAFVDLVEDTVGNKNKHILDVGPGVIPYSSILLGQDFDSVDAMDKNFWISNEALQKLNVTAHSEYLTRNTSVDDFDIIVGRMPCSAIDTIVYLCAKYGKKYFIKTCDCEMPSPDDFYKKWGIAKPFKDIISKEDNKINWFGWSTMLPELDKDICFCGDYAFNVGNNIECRNLIEKGYKKEENMDIRPYNNVVTFSTVDCSRAKWHTINDEKEMD